ncbi:hypothetical protein NQ317_003391 [Molorchus minor]|uniref:Uncharacterized protein n=1 Tax=Molorchus minor TaxID=1323400 RepID=A0ABQ9K7U7_9CUCU|nr:hypothetical protein NQ317_003391 [Molorchus minor]
MQPILDSTTLNDGPDGEIHCRVEILLRVAMEGTLPQRLWFRYGRWCPFYGLTKKNKLSFNQWMQGVL